MPSLLGTLKHTLGEWERIDSQIADEESQIADRTWTVFLGQSEPAAILKIIDQFNSLLEYLPGPSRQNVETCHWESARESRIFNNTAALERLTRRLTPNRTFDATAYELIPELRSHLKDVMDLFIYHPSSEAIDRAFQLSPPQSLPRVFKTIPTGDLPQDEQECPICKAAYGSSMEEEALQAPPPCSHLFCRSCLQKWLEKNSTCPICRRDLYKLTRELILASSFSPREDDNGG
jgi:hypothetical protein